MPERDWGFISNGGAFESLVHALLFAKDPSTRLFGRPGKDAGQDASSEDGTTIYQAKYGQGLKMAGVVTLALAELTKIKKYKKPAHANHRHWEKATSWILATNCLVNPSDVSKWQEEVVSEFSAEGLKAELWSIETLNGLLDKHPEVGDVFFNGENRVFGGLKEAYDILQADCIGPDSLDLPLFGRDNELAEIMAFAAQSEARILPVTGVGGIGKSRLLFEALKILAEEDWRILWAFPESMAKSSQWFRFLNGGERVCAVIDDPYDPAVLRILAEQMIAGERNNWWVLLAHRTDKDRLLDRYKNNTLFHEPIRLTPLDETTSHTLLASHSLGDQAPTPHQIHSLTGGNPGWLCLVADLVKNGHLKKLPASINELGKIRIDTCMDNADAGMHSELRNLLRCLALLGVTKRNTDFAFSSDLHRLFAFVSEHGDSPTTRKPTDTVFQSLFNELVRLGLARNFGRDGCCYAVQPYAMRLHILLDWLLVNNKPGSYTANVMGVVLIRALCLGEAPAGEKVLSALTTLALQAMTENDGQVFMKPLFAAICQIATNGSLMERSQIAKMLSTIGRTDPDSALTILAKMIADVKEPEPVKGFFDEKIYTHNDLLAELPWVMLNLSTDIYDQHLAKRFLCTFRKLVDHEPSLDDKSKSGKSPAEILDRQLRDSENSPVFRTPAFDMAMSDMNSGKFEPSTFVIIKSLLNPDSMVESRASKWSLTLSPRVVDPRSKAGQQLRGVRTKLIDVIVARTHPQLEDDMWRLLADSHHAIHRHTLQWGKNGQDLAKAAKMFTGILVDDLERCRDIMNVYANSGDVNPAIAAREIWKWYLSHGDDNELRRIAEECEERFKTLFPYQPQEFFRFVGKEELVEVTRDVAEKFREAESPDAIAAFFSQSEQYLAAARRGGRDMADGMRLADLAEMCLDFVDLKTASPFTSFIESCIGENPQPLAHEFAKHVCRLYRRRGKMTGNAAFDAALQSLFDKASDKTDLVWSLYSSAHPDTIGPLDIEDWEIASPLLPLLSEEQRFTLLGVFYFIDSRAIDEKVREGLAESALPLGKAKALLTIFIRSSRATALRYKWRPEQFPIALILEQICARWLAGAILDLPEMDWFHHESGYRMDIAAFHEFVLSRIALENAKDGAHARPILPRRLDASKWVEFNSADETQIAIFQNLCAMVLNGGYVATHWLPGQLAALDVDGGSIGNFVKMRLEETPTPDLETLLFMAEFAAAYSNDTPAWRGIAARILEAGTMDCLSREDRWRIFSALTPNPVSIYSSAPGEVPVHFEANLAMATRLLAEDSGSQLEPYRQWAVLCAESELNDAKGKAEEDSFDG